MRGAIQGVGGREGGAELWQEDDEGPVGQDAVLVRVGAGRDRRRGGGGGRQEAAVVQHPPEEAHLRAVREPGRTTITNYYPLILHVLKLAP